MKDILCIFAAFLLCGLVSAGPAGTEFALSFMQNNQVSTSSSSRLMLDIFNPSMISASVKVIALGKIYEQILQPGQGGTFQLPKEVEMIGTKPTNQTVLVLSDQQILVSSFNYKLSSSDTSLIYPVEDWGTEYYVFTPQLGPLGSFKEFSIVNYDSLNSVEIQLSGLVQFKGSIYPRGSKLTLNLKPLESVQIQSQEDLTGSRVKAQQPVALFTGHSCAWFYSTCSHVYEQLLPVSSWGREFLVVSLNFTWPQFRFDTVQILASQTTNLKINSQNGATLETTIQAGAFYYVNLFWPDSLHITADKGIQVLYEFNGGTTLSGGPIEPFLINILPNELFSASYMLEGQTDFTNQAVIIAQTEDLDGLTFDMLRLPQNVQWRQAGDSKYSWAEITYNQGSGFHKVTSPNSPFGLYSIGVGIKNGYGSSAPGISPVSYATCSVSGDPHYKTFDNKTYDFQGTCTYTAAQACHLQGTQLTPFTVVVENSKWDQVQVAPDVSMAKVVVVEVYNMTLILRRNQLKQIMVNGILANIPVSLLGGQVKVFQEGTHYTILTDFGLKVTYDMVYHVTITVPVGYRDKMCGLCGNYNGVTSDEYQLPDGKLTADVNAFGAEWKVPVIGVVCDDGCSGDLCPKCDPQKKVIYEKDCGIIADPKGPFAACHSVINPESYFSDCVYDVCVGGGDRDMLCHSIGSYVIDCQNFGVTIQNWRTQHFCPLSCPPNSHYQTCAETCGTPCPGLTDIITCDTNTCAEGCACDSGFYFNGTDCVNANLCGCYEDGKSYDIGESMITDDCSEVLSCLATGEVQHKPMECKSNEVCQVRNGARGCYPSQCVIAAGGMFTYYSGGKGTITAAGAYEIVRVCNGALEMEWFRLVADVQICGTHGVATTAAIYVFFDDLIIIVNSKHEIWFNGMRVHKHHYTLQNGVLVKVEKDFVVIQKYGITVTYSNKQDLSVSVGKHISNHICGACGELAGNISLDLFQAQLDKHRAPDFPRCT